MNSESADAKARVVGRVAQILNEFELVINVGAEAGVGQGMKFAVLAEAPQKIVDPVSKQELDAVDREKVRVQASEVRPKITICRTYRKKVIPAGPMYFPHLFEVGLKRTDASPPREIPETLRALDSSLPKPLTQDESYVKINDRVVQIDE